MPTMSSSPSGSAPVFWGGLLIVTSVMTIVGGLVVWSHREAKQQVIAANPEELDRKHIRAVPPPPPIDDMKPPTLHGLKYDVEKGTTVVKIQVVPDGDELIVDANTGRLIESRPGRASAPGPIGKFAAPFVPMM